MERLHVLGLVVDGATKFGAEAQVGFSVVERKVVELQEFKLIDGESKSPGDICGCEELGRCVRFGGERHVCRRLMWCVALYSVSSCLAC